MAYKKMRPRKKVCYFKKNKITHIDFKDVELLSRFINPDGKISSRAQTGTSAKYQTARQGHQERPLHGPSSLSGTDGPLRCSFPGSLVPEITARTVLHGPPRRGPFLMPWGIA